MNWWKRAYCRVFQTVFRIALPILPYRDPIVLKNLGGVADILNRQGKRCPLLVTDGFLRTTEAFTGLETALREKGFHVFVFDGTKPNPTTEMVRQAVELYNANGCDCLIAFGGGSPMDVAKAAGACIARPNKPLAKMAGILRVRRKLPLLIAVPTTAGTGSETTLAAVLVDDVTRHKYVINDFPLIPRYAVLDSSVLHTLPFAVAAATGMDALTHAVEAYIGRSTTRQTRSDAETAVRLVFANLERAAGHTDRDAEENMLQASHLAGRAFTRSYVGYIHALSHALSGAYDLPHGQTNATLLPIVLEAYGEAVYPKLARLAVCAGLGKADEPRDVLAKRFLDGVKELNRRLGIPRCIDGIREEDIPRLAAFADKEANPLYPVPVLWDETQLQEIYRKVKHYAAEGSK